VLRLALFVLLLIETAGCRSRSRPGEEDGGLVRGAGPIVVVSATPIALPVEGDGAASPVLPVDVSADGRLWVETRPVSEPELRQKADAAQRATPDVRAVIRAHPDVRHGRVIEVLDLLKQAGIRKIAFAVATADAGR
jgi:biopolymer transport protein ExbD